jgi:hypothetical protein
MKIRILLYGEGNFSFTSALIKQIVAELKGDVTLSYNVVATDLQTSDGIESIKINQEINQYLQDQGIKDRLSYEKLMYINAETDDAFREGKIKGSFDRIIFNFPTVGSWKGDTVFEKCFAQIRRNSNKGDKSLLKNEGEVEFRYWVTTHGQREYEYRLARGQKATGFLLKKRDIVDLKVLKEQGYSHISQHSHQCSSVTERKNEFEGRSLPMRAVYQLDPNFPTNKNKLLADEYNELSDEENELCHDAMPAREATESYITNNNLNFKGKEQTRPNYKLTLFNEKNYDINKIITLIENKKYRAAELYTNLLIESGHLQFKNMLSSDLKNLIKSIDDAFNKLEKNKYTNDSLLKYHSAIWYSKLKVLTGVEIPELIASYPFR